MANTILSWKGAVEPSGASPSGNEIRLWKGAVEPAYVAPAAPAASSTTSGHISTRRSAKKPHVIYIDQPEPEPDAPVVEQKRMLRMTPEVKAMIEKYKKKGPRGGGGLIGGGGLL